MKKWMLVFLCAGSLGLIGCAEDKVSTAEKTVKKLAQSVKEYNMHKDVEVHTEEEMKEFALKCLEEKYGKKFLIDDAHCHYNHFNGHEEQPMVLRAKAYPEEDESDICGIFVEEPNVFQDNYSINFYRQEIEEKIVPEMDKFGIEGKIEFDYPYMTGTIGNNLSAEDIIYDKNTCICFFPSAAMESDMSVYIPLIRKWLDFLYTCDYDWYFALTDEEDMDYQFIGISKGDYGYTSSDQWSDEKIMEGIDGTMSLMEHRK